jgi:hypothetical protein
MSDSYVYSIQLTREEYQSAMYMCDRGYLGEITIHATDVNVSDDESTYTLLFRESDAWKVLATIEADPHAVWALTTPSTSLGVKFQAFLEGIV